VSGVTTEEAARVAERIAGAGISAQQATESIALSLGLDTEDGRRRIALALEQLEHRDRIYELEHLVGRTTFAGDALRLREALLELGRQLAAPLLELGRRLHRR
jgi:hypothetical protein